MDVIKLSYAPLFNAGDLFNKDIVEKLSGKKVENAKMYNADMIAIGGALMGAQYSNRIKRKFSQKLLSIVYGNKPLYVWGSGFFKDENNNNFYRKNLKVCALRGAKTQKKLSYIMKQKYDVPLADAGLLAHLFVGKNITKEHEIGIIPHMFQQNDDIIKEMINKGAYFIDIKRSAKEVIDDIAKCETILSSSLHGLIFADSLHIPSMHILGDKMLTDGNFKFEDYYSSFGINDNPYIIEKGKIPTKKTIIDNYKIDGDLVETKKQQLISCFPKF